MGGAEKMHGLHVMLFTGNAEILRKRGQLFSEILLSIIINLQVIELRRFKTLCNWAGADECLG